MTKAGTRIRSTLRPATAAACLLAIAAIACPSARAQEQARPVTPEGAEALAESLMLGLKRYLPTRAEGLAFEWDGRVRAEPVGDAYAVTLPALAVRTEDGDRFEVGAIGLRLQPAEEGRYRLAETTIPPSIPFLDATGKTTGRLTLGSQRLTGLWVPAYESFVDLDARFADVRLTDATSKAGLAIGEATARIAYTQDNETRWGGVNGGALRDIRLIGKTGAPAGRIGALEIEGSVDGLDMDRLALVNRRVQALDAWGATPTPADSVELLGLFQGMLAGGTMTAKVAGLTFKDPDDGTAVGLDELGFHLGVTGLQGNAATLRVGYRHDGLSIAPTPEPRDLLPHAVDLTVAAAGMPATDLWRTLLGFLGTVNADQGQADEVAGLLAPQILERLTAAGSEIRVETLTVDTPATKGQATGSAHFDADSPHGLTANLDVVLTGLNAAIKAMKPNKGKKPDQATRDALATATVFQALGQAGKDATGRETRSYHIEVAADGRVLLNGADISTLMQITDP